MTRSSVVSGRITGSILLLSLALSPLALPAQTAPAPAAPAAGTPSAKQVADQVMQAMGGKAAWDNTHFLRFTFAGRRTHHWDKWTGRHRVEGQGQDGKKYVVLENINTHEGQAWVDGKKVEGDELKQWLERGYGAWVNDTYWLLMPYKMQDPGVNLDYAGNEVIDGKTYDKLHLSFGKVGLTPGDQYWAYVNRDTHLMDRWAFLLQDEPRDAAPSAWLWEGWQKFGKIQLAPHRVQVGGDRKLELSDIAVFDTLPDAVFTSNTPVVLQQ
jgi:hypothetical protein